MTMNDPLLRTDSYAKIFLYNIPENRRLCAAHTSACAIKCARTSCAKPSEQARCAFRT